LLTSRIIARLDVKGPNLVAPVQREGLRVLGRPQDFAIRYEAEGADELVFLDLVASLYQRPFLPEIVSRVSEQVFIPLTVGGGIRSVEDARRLLLNGADKIALNTAAIKRPSLITELAEGLGCQCVVILVEAKRRNWGWEAMTDNAREPSGRDALDWIQEAAALGAGEIILLSVDRDGLGQGIDLGLIRAVSALGLPLPLVASGGCGNAEHILQALQAGADAVACSSMFGYWYADQVAAEGAFAEGNLEWKQGSRGAAPFPGASIASVKKQLSGQVRVRI